MLLVWTRELNRRLRGTGIDTFAVHPGVVHTPGEWKAAGDRPLSWATWLGGLTMGQTVGWGATSILYAATEPQLASRGGSYIGPRHLHLFGYAGSNTAPRAPLNPAAHDPAAARRVFDETTAVLLECGAAGASPLPSPDTLAAAALAAAAGPLGAAAGGMPLGKPGAAPAAEPFGPAAGGGAAFQVFEAEMVAGDYAGAAADYDGGGGATAAEEVADEMAGAALLGLALGAAAEALGDQEL